MKSLAPLLSTLLVAQVVHAQAGTCYFANGTALPVDNPEYNDFEPCTSGATTTCCGTNRALPPGSVRKDGAPIRDECLPNGLCQNRALNADDGTERIAYWVDFCTDKDVNSKNCLNICRPRYPFGNVRVTPCSGKADSEQWCCGDKTDCCSTNSVIMLAQVLGGTLSSNGASSSLAATSSSGSSATTLSSALSTVASVSSTASPISSTVTSTPSSAPNSQNAPASSASSPSGLPKGAIAGIVVGAIAGLAILAAAIFLLRRSRRKSAATPVVEAPDNPPRYNAHAYAGEKGVGRPNELPQGLPHELGSGLVAELPAENIGAKGKLGGKLG